LLEPQNSDERPAPALSTGVPNNPIAGWEDKARMPFF
jgi:hypothetical protein